MGLALGTSMAVTVSACEVDGTAQPDAAAVASAAFSSSPGNRTTAPATSATTRSNPGSPDLGSTIAPQTSQTSGPPSGTATFGTIEDHSTSEPPTTSTGTSAQTSTQGPTVTMADDGFTVSIIVTTVWARALVARGANVGIRTIHTAAAQVAALESEQVDLVELHNGALLDYLDENSGAVGRAEVDSAIAGKLPAGLTVLTSTAARDDAQLTVSATTAAKFRLQSVSDLGDHLKDLTLLLPPATAASTFTRQLSSHYGLTFPITKTADLAGVRTVTAINSTAAVGLMFASQYQNDDYQFVALTDPEHLFRTENFIPLVSTRTFPPSMRATIDAVSAKLTLSALRTMRKKVAIGHSNVPDVADEWLASVGLK